MNTDRLTSQHLKKFFADYQLAPQKHIKSKQLPASVLIPILEHPRELTVLLTYRTEHLTQHAGQISFPGGRIEAHDQSLAETALRETQEEIGLYPTQIEMLGQLKNFQSLKGIIVTPFVGLIQPPIELELDANEVASVFEAPLSFVLNPEHHQAHSYEIQGTVRRYYQIDYQQHRIWGLTANMLVELANLLKS